MISSELQNQRAAWEAHLLAGEVREGRMSFEYASNRMPEGFNLSEVLLRKKGDKGYNLPSP